MTRKRRKPKGRMHVAYLLSFQFKPTKPIRPIIYSSYTFIRQILWFPLVSIRSLHFPSFPFVSLRFSSFPFVSLRLTLIDRLDGLVSQSVMLARKAKEAEEAVVEDTFHRELARFIIFCWIS